MMRSRSERYLDKIELLTATITSDAYGNTAPSSYQHLDEVCADVEELTGSTLLWYNSRGYLKPLIIKMWAYPKPFDAIKWRGKTIAIISQDTDESNTLKVIIRGNIIKDEI